MGTLRRECLDHMIILNEKHLYDVLHEYISEYYNVSRTHMSLNKDSPVHRHTQTNGKITSKPILGGLHHIYRRVAWNLKSVQALQRCSASMAKDLRMLSFSLRKSNPNLSISTCQRANLPFPALQISQFSCQMIFCVRQVDFIDSYRFYNHHFLLLFVFFKFQYVPLSKSNTVNIDDITYGEKFSSDFS